MADFKTAIPGLLQSFNAKLRHEAEQLVSDGAVVNLDALPGEVDADVMLDDHAVHVKWTRGPQGWEGLADAADDELHSLALCTVLTAIQKNSAQLFPEPSLPEEPFQTMIERKLGRRLMPEEEQYLAKLDKRFQRVKQTGQVFDHDMVRLHAKWSIESIEPLQLWPSPPAALREFWDCIALALDEKGLAPPPFLRSVANLEEVRDRLREWKQARTVPQWRERIRKFAALDEARSPALRRSCDFRLIITPSEARLQWRSGSEDKFTAVAASQIPQLRKEHARGSLVLSGEAELLLLACFCHFADSASDSLRLDVERNASWLGSLLHQPQLRSRLLTLDEVPFHFADTQLRWGGSEDETLAAFRLRLEDEPGAPAALPLRVLPGAETLFLGGDTIYRGPPWFGDDTRIEQPIDIPLAALASPDGIAFLEKLNVELPASIKKKIRREQLTVQIKAGCLAKQPSGGADYVALQYRAVDSKGLVREMLRERGWERVAASAAGSDDEIVCYDRGLLHEAAATAAGLNAIYDPAENGFRARVTKTFPEQFERWAGRLPDHTVLDTDERLHSILADPLIARVRLEASQTENIDWLDLKMVFEIEGSDLSPADIRRLVAAKGGFVLLADGTWRRVQIELTDEQREMIDKMGLDLDEFSDEAHRVHLRHLAGQKAAGMFNPKAWQQIAARLSDPELSVKPAVPSSLRVTLRPYQVEGFHFLSYLAANRIGGILADDMGLGKTLQSIAWILWLRDRESGAEAAAKDGNMAVSPSLVVCPKSVLDVWATEFAKAAPHLRVLVLHDKDHLKLDTFRDTTDVLVLNYAQLRGLIDGLAAIRWLAVILDEGQQIKNPDSKAAKAARDLRAANRLVLTGTPVENRLMDLWSLMAFATPGSLGERAYFHRHFDRRKDDRASERLSARLRPFMIRRTKSQVATELPSRTEETMLCEMSDAQDRLYREELARAQHLVLSSTGFEALRRQRFAILQALTRLRQICCHPSLVRHDAAGDESAKLTATLELIEELHAEGHKVLLFSQFVSMLKIIRQKLEEMKLPFHWLTGASTNRAEIVRGFQGDKNASVFLLSLKAGGSGLNLTAASYVILYDPWWNPAVEAQAIDRTHRIGQTQPVMAYRMLTKNTIEEKILLLQQKKNLMASAILGGDEGFSRTLERADFEFLFDIDEKEK